MPKIVETIQTDATDFNEFYIKFVKNNIQYVAHILFPIGKGKWKIK